MLDIKSEQEIDQRDDGEENQEINRIQYHIPRGGSAAPHLLPAHFMNKTMILIILDSLLLRKRPFPPIRKRTVGVTMMCDKK